MEKNGGENKGGEESDGEAGDLSGGDGAGGVTSIAVPGKFLVGISVELSCMELFCALAMDEGSVIWISELRLPSCRLSVCLLATLPFIVWGFPRTDAFTSLTV